MNKISKEELEKIWIDFKETKENKLKNQLVEYYYPLVKKIAKKLSKKYNNKSTSDDLTSFGLDGLYKAIERYDLTRKIKFDTYAHQRIRGSMIDSLRAIDWVPRSVRIRNSQIEEIKIRLEAKKLNKALDYDIIAEAKIDEKDFHKKYKKYNPSIISSIDNCLGNSEFSFEEESKKDFNNKLIDNKNSSPYARILRKEFLSKLLGKHLSKIEKKIIYYFYYENLKIKEISNILNIKEQKISQLHQNIIKKLRKNIDKNIDFYNDLIVEIQKTCRRDSMITIL